MPYTLLIVDDSKLARMAVIRALQSCAPDWQRAEAASAAEALDLLQQDAPHVALIDFNMPTRDGLDLAADVRAVKPTMPIGIISANHQQEVVDRARALGAAFLPKPLTEKALQEFLATASRQLQGASS